MSEDTTAAPVSSEAPASAYSWYVLGVLVVVYILNFIDRQILSILAVDIKRDLALTDGQLGFLGGAAFAVFYALCLILNWWFYLRPNAYVKNP